MVDGVSSRNNKEILSSYGNGNCDTVVHITHFNGFDLKNDSIFRIVMITSMHTRRVNKHLSNSRKMLVQATLCE